MIERNRKVGRPSGLEDRRQVEREERTWDLVHLFRTQRISTPRLKLGSR